MYDEYHKTEEDIKKILHYLEIHDPANANREYASQFIDTMQGVGGELARIDESLAELVKKNLDEKKTES